MLGLSANDQEVLDKVMTTLGISTDVLISRIISEVVEFDRTMQIQGLGRMAEWRDASSAPELMVPADFELPTGAVNQRFAEIADEFHLSAYGLLMTCVRKLIEDHGRDYWWWHTKTYREPLDKALGYVVTMAVDGLPTTIRQTGFMWPRDVPFAWTPVQCKAVILGYEVMWPDREVNFIDHARGAYEGGDASDESRSLALDAIFDFALQEALLSYERRQFTRQCEGRSKK